jgi:peptidoglycan/xylan/chitin deacetylase (PgdA/CDA1 family)
MQPSLRKLYLLYHELRPSRSPYSYVLETSEFEKHLDIFSQLQANGSSRLAPELTFDDGHISNFKYALPILQSRNMKARFFITVGWTGQKTNFMDWQQLKELQQAGQQIGAHGWTHTLLTHCNDKELHTELNTARLTLEDKLGIPITTMSLPGGRFNSRILSACREAGYIHIFTSIPKSEPVPPEELIGRLNIRADMSLDWISNLFRADSDTLSTLGRRYRWKSAAQSLMGDRLYQKLWAILNRQETDREEEGEAANENPARNQ